MTWSLRDWTYCSSCVFVVTAIKHLETDKLQPFCVVISYFTGHCSLNCCVRICPCVKQENQIDLVAKKGLQECCNSNCVCHLDAVWQTLLNKNFQWSDAFTFTHNRLCGVFNICNDERHQARWGCSEPTSSDCLDCKWLENLLQRMSLSSSVKHYSRSPFDFSASFFSP